MRLMQIQVLLDDDHPDTASDQLIGQVNDFGGTASQPTQFSDNQGVGIDEKFQQFIDVPLFAGFTRGNGDGQEIIDPHVSLAGKLQNFQFLIIDILLVG